MKRVITYGTFDVLHYGHINLLKRAKALGDYLIVVLSSDEFNQIKNKKSFYTYVLITFFTWDYTVDVVYIIIFSRNSV